MIINVLIDYSTPNLAGSAKVNQHYSNQYTLATVGMVRWYDEISDRITRYYLPTRTSLKRAQRLAHLAQVNKARIA